jgi:hypothetical protein
LKPYRGWPEPNSSSRWAKWIYAIEGNEFVRATTSTDELYLDSYERYAGESIAFSLFGRSFADRKQKIDRTPVKLLML